jgi:hypothetical protein
MHIEPAQVWKGQIEDDGLRGMLFDDAQRIDAVADGSDSVARACESKAIKFAECGIVLDDEDGWLSGPKQQPL